MRDVLDIHIRNYYIILICYANFFTSSPTLLEIHFLLEQGLHVVNCTDFASALCSFHLFILLLFIYLFYLCGPHLHRLIIPHYSRPILE